MKNWNDYLKCIGRKTGAGSIIRILPVPVFRGKNLYIENSACIHQAKMKAVVGQAAYVGRLHHVAHPVVGQEAACEEPGNVCSISSFRYCLGLVP